MMVKIIKADKVDILIKLKDQHKMPDGSTLGIFHIISEIFIMPYVLGINDFVNFLQHLLVQAFIFLRELCQYAL